MRSIETPQTTPKHPKPPQTSTKPPQTTSKPPKPPSNHPKQPSNHPKPHRSSLLGYTSTPSTPPLPLHSLRTKTTTTFIFPLFRFTPAILSLMCCLMLSNNLQTFEVINYTITLQLRGHGSIISQILMGLCAPRMHSIKCLVSLQYEQYIMRHLDAYLVWCVLWW